MKNLLKEKEKREKVACFKKEACAVGKELLQFAAFSALLLVVFIVLFVADYAKPTRRRR